MELSWPGELADFESSVSFSNAGASLDCCRTDWILNIDADERLAPGPAAGSRAGRGLAASSGEHDKRALAGSPHARDAVVA